MSKDYNGFDNLATTNRLWHWFKELSLIPRNSGKEQQATQFLIQFAKDHNLGWMQDAAGNVIITKPAQNGGSDTTVALQAHIDMVCQKTDDSDFDFDTQGINPYIDGEWVTAGETTLGADNGIGLAQIMAILESKDLSHPNLEGVFTVEEETGLTGAEELDSSMLKATTLLNFDSGNFATITIGCAGGLDTCIDASYKQHEVSAKHIPFHLVVEGLQGGHSGGSINHGRENSNKLMVRMLQMLSQHVTIYVSQINSDYPVNAIPRMTQAYIYVDGNDDINRLKNEFKRLSDLFKNDNVDIEPNLNFTLNEHPAPSKMIIDQNEQARILQTLNVIPNGVCQLNPHDITTTVSSTNLATINLADGKLRITSMQRGVDKFALYDIGNRIADCFRLANLHDLNIEMFGAYDGWKANYNSPLIQKVVDIYQSEFNFTPTVRSSQGGLECPLIDKNNVMDKVALGPDMQGCHAPGEKVHIESTNKFHKLANILITKL